MHRPRITANFLLALAVPAVGALAAIGVASAAVDDSQPASVVPASASADDLSGPCDEAEHANDPRCAGAPATQTTAPSTTVAGAGAGVDISGPCDEAEHANDPRCTGSVVTDDNSGPGSGDDSDDSSGPGHGGDDGDDSSGPGSGDDSDD
ncbi:MAG: hypothetical protein ACRDZU_16430 [Acidimicrobiales bacterium]